MASAALASATPVDTHDEIMDLGEAAKFMRVSESWLRRSDVPRSKLGARVVFVRSQLVAYVSVRLTHRIEAPAK